MNHAERLDAMLKKLKEMDFKDAAVFKTMMSLRERLIDEGLSRIVVDRVIGRVNINVTDEGAARSPDLLETYIEVIAISIVKFFRALQDVDDIARPADLLVDIVSKMEIELE
jgi:hypothetical protein